ncbi:GNAT family N-acetyltransferase [Streptomyces sp. OE57]|uniref:GNAT family N-acetyltransferase n=1 Tax=Streptomyces lacaronensis TaxID=3379885 RepID=UPI0039B738B9
MTQPSATPAVEPRDNRRRHEIIVDGKRVGLTAYRDRGEQRVFYHTEVEDAFVPVCRHVTKYLDRHGEFSDITGPVTPEVLQRLDTELADGRVDPLTSL